VYVPKCLLSYAVFMKLILNGNREHFRTADFCLSAVRAMLIDRLRVLQQVFALSFHQA
jgi:hypothetical protein